MTTMTTKTFFFLTLMLFCISSHADINQKGLNAQMVNLNLQLHSKNKMVKSDIALPFYQTAELEKKVGDKNVFIELNPRHGKKSDEIALEIKLSKHSGGKILFKKEIVAKINQESQINYHGMSMKVKPFIN